METLGERLRDERERLGYTQPAFAALAGASKRSQVGWEQGRSMPDAAYLTAIAAADADIQFILTGSPLPDDLRHNYRMAAIATLRAMSPELASSYVHSLPKVAEKNRVDAAIERNLLRYFRVCTHPDQSTICQLAERLAAGRKPAESDKAKKP